jgi:hypothetical protein
LLASNTSLLLQTNTLMPERNTLLVERSQCLRGIMQTVIEVFAVSLLGETNEGGGRLGG